MQWPPAYLQFGLQYRRLAAAVAMFGQRAVQIGTYRVGHHNSEDSMGVMKREDTS